MVEYSDAHAHAFSPWPRRAPISYRENRPKTSRVIGSITVAVVGRRQTGHNGPKGTGATHDSTSRRECARRRALAAPDLPCCRRMGRRHHRARPVSRRHGAPIWAAGVGLRLLLLHVRPVHGDRARARQFCSPNPRISDALVPPPRPKANKRARQAYYMRRGGRRFASADARRNEDGAAEGEAGPRGLTTESCRGNAPHGARLVNRSWMPPERGRVEGGRRRSRPAFPRARGPGFGKGNIARRISKRCAFEMSVRARELTGNVVAITTSTNYGANSRYSERPALVRKDKLACAMTRRPPLRSIRHGRCLIRLIVSAAAGMNDFRFAPSRI